MEEIWKLDGDRIRYVRLVHSSHGYEAIFTAYDLGDRPWKVDTGHVYVREVSLFQRPRWRRVAEAKYVKEVVVYGRFPLEVEIERHRLE